MIWNHKHTTLYLQILIITYEYLMYIYRYHELVYISVVFLLNFKIKSILSATD